jgi:hypothetical protein
VTVRLTRRTVSLCRRSLPITAARSGFWEATPEQRLGMRLAPPAAHPNGPDQTPLQRPSLDATPPLHWQRWRDGQRPSLARQGKRGCPLMSSVALLARLMRMEVMRVSGSPDVSILYTSRHETGFTVPGGRRPEGASHLVEGSWKKAKRR